MNNQTFFDGTDPKNTAGVSTGSKAESWWGLSGKASRKLSNLGILYTQENADSALNFAVFKFFHNFKVLKLCLLIMTEF